MPPVGFEPTISTGERPLGPANKQLIFFAVALRPNAGHGLLILEVSRSHNDAAQSVGFLLKSD